MATLPVRGNLYACPWFEASQGKGGGRNETKIEVFHFKRMRSRLKKLSRKLSNEPIKMGKMFFLLQNVTLRMVQHEKKKSL